MLFMLQFAYAVLLFSIVLNVVLIVLLVTGGGKNGSMQ